VIKEIIKKILRGDLIKRGDDLSYLLTADLEELCIGADKVCKKYCGKKINLCTIINGRSGKCSEDCKFCAQSAHYNTGINEYGFLDEDIILSDCKANEAEGVHRYSIVTAGRCIQGRDFEKALSAYKKINEECNIQLCASHGLLTEDDFVALKLAGVTRYHQNLETSKRYFQNISTTHTYEDKIKCINLAKKVGLEICSGGIIGMGETWEDRIDMAISLSELGVVSIPLNALIPIKGTPFEELPIISEEDILKQLLFFV
jgi:biotin synthase